MLGTMEHPAVVQNGNGSIVAAQFCCSAKENAMRAAPIAMLLTQLICCDHARLKTDRKRMICRGHSVSDTLVLYLMEADQADSVLIACSSTDKEAIECGYSSLAFEEEILSQTNELLRPHGLKLASRERDLMVDDLARRKVKGFCEEDFLSANL